MEKYGEENIMVKMLQLKYFCLVMSQAGEEKQRSTILACYVTKIFLDTTHLT